MRLAALSLRLKMSDCIIFFVVRKRVLIVMSKARGRHIGFGVLEN